MSEVKDKMSERLSPRSVRNKVTGHRTKNRFDRIWIQLPPSVVEARAGLIPSCETDGCPPPESLTSPQRLRWYRGLPVLCKIEQRSSLQFRVLRLALDGQLRIANRQQDFD